MVKFTFSILDSFWVNLVKKNKIVSLSWNLVFRLIRICRFQWWWSFFSVFDHKYLSWPNLVKKSKIVFWKWNLFQKLEYPEFNGGVHYTCFRLEIHILAKFDPKNQNYQFKGNAQFVQNMTFGLWEKMIAQLQTHEHTCHYLRYVTCANLFTQKRCLILRGD